MKRTALATGDFVVAKGRSNELARGMVICVTSANKVAEATQPVYYVFFSDGTMGGPFFKSELVTASIQDDR